MRTSVQSGQQRLCASGLRIVLRALLVALIGYSASASLLTAQSASPGGQSAPSALPSAPAPTSGQGPISIPNAPLDASVPGIDSAAHSGPLADTGGSWQPNSSTSDPFQPNFGNYSGASTGNIGFSPARGFGSGRQGTGAFTPMGGTNRFGGASQWGGYGMGGANASARDANSLFGPSPFGLPSLNQFMRGSYNLPLNASTGGFRFSYQDALRPGGGFTDLARPSASAMFSTSDLGNGMFLSAGTSFGHSSVGAPAVGSNAAAAKHSGPSVALKLSF